MLPSTPKSISRETTIEGGTIDTEFLGGLIEYLCERIGSTLRDYGRQARSIGLRIRYVDHFSAHQTVRLTKPSNDERELLATAKELFKKLFTRRVAVRLVGVNVINLDHRSPPERTLRHHCKPPLVFEPRRGQCPQTLRLELVFYGKGSSCANITPASPMAWCSPLPAYRGNFCSREFLFRLPYLRNSCANASCRLRALMFVHFHCHSHYSFLRGGGVSGRNYCSGGGGRTCPPSR